MFTKSKKNYASSLINSFNIEKGKKDKNDNKNFTLCYFMLPGINQGCGPRSELREEEKTDPDRTLKKKPWIRNRILPHVKLIKYTSYFFLST